MASFNKNDRVIHNINFPILPMKVIESDSIETKCKLEYNNEFIASVTYFTFELRLFSVQKPDFAFYFIFNRENSLPEIQMPYLSDNSEKCKSFYVSFFKDWGKQCKLRGYSTTYIKHILIEVSEMNDQIAEKKMIMNKIKNKCLSSKFCDCYAFIEYSYVETAEYFDYVKNQQDEFDIIALTIIANLIHLGAGYLLDPDLFHLISENL